MDTTNLVEQADGEEHNNISPQLQAYFKPSCLGFTHVFVVSVSCLLCSFVAWHPGTLVPRQKRKWKPHPPSACGTGSSGMPRVTPRNCSSIGWRIARCCVATLRITRE
eukprot:TRINITY_DN76558_c0_g1_i1.p1 TRINITY_DN76558_c0_g1~~TRINITY_DN76558_c0_g1_i1.p1  ORF type:complete len:108 (-),score=0.61 TRINITY_DN76558_c0_g1_i1:11-334(-)